MARSRLGSVLLLLLLSLVSSAIGCGSSSDGSGANDPGASNRPATAHTTLVEGSRTEPPVPLPKGDPPEKLVVTDIREGKGVEAREGDLLATKLVAKFVTGRDLESNWRNSRPFFFHLGAEEANPGWEKGIPGMRVGGLRKLIVPPDEGSRFRVVGDGKPKDTLVYIVELIAILPPELANRREPRITPPKGPPPEELQRRDLIKGTGPAAQNGDTLTVEYVGVRYNGRSFTNSWKRRKEFDFELGSEAIEVNLGWEKGLPGMRVGGRRELIVPPDLQSRSGAAQRSKPADTLIYVIDLIGITEPGAQPAEPRQEAGGGSTA